MEKRPDREQHRGDAHLRGRHGRSGDFFGLDVERMSPEARVAVGALVITPVVLAAALVLVLAPEMWWLIFTFGWTIFPAFGLFLSGIAGVVDGGKELPSGDGKERELLGALREHGELTPAQAAMETSLTVAEADEKLKELAEGGHLDVRVRGGGLFYALWEPDGEEAERGAGRELEGRG